MTLGAEDRKGIKAYESSSGGSLINVFGSSSSSSFAGNYSKGLSISVEYHTIIP
jgi:hypothetical protein